jgi:hypothetical protein
MTPNSVCQVKFFFLALQLPLLTQGRLGLFPLLPLGPSLQYLMAHLPHFFQYAPLRLVGFFHIPVAVFHDIGQRFQTCD